MDPDDAACAAFADGDLSAAIRSLDSAISVCEPNSVRMAWCLVNRAECEVQLELFKRAQKDCDEALAIDPVGPAAPRACLLKGVALQHLGKKKLAARVLAEGLQQACDFRTQIELRAALSGENPSLPSAPAAAKKNEAAQSSSPVSSPSQSSAQERPQTRSTAPPSQIAPKDAMLLNESYMLVNQGQYDEAVKNFDKIIATYPTLSVAFIGRGTAYAMSRNLQPAIVDFSEAIRLQPDLMEAYKRRGQARAAAGQESEGIQDLNDALALPSMSPADAVELTIERGLMHQKMGNYPAAVADLRSGLEGKGDSAPDGFPILNHIGLCLTSMGQISAAIDSFKACLAQRPSYKEAMVNCAQAHKELGQFETSKAYFDKAIALADNFTRAYHLRGLLHHARGEHARAALDFEKVVSLERGETTLEALFMLSSCKHAQGHFRDAVATYGQVIKLGSTSETHSLISKMAFYQREMCLYVLTYADRSAVSVCWDDIMPAVFKEAWCKKSPPQLLVMRGYQLLSEDDCMDAADVAKLPSKPGLEEHCRVAQLLGAGMQYNTAGFMVNGRQHRMAGLATLECSQFMQVENVSGKSRCSWQTVYERAVAWRQISEPNDAVFWVNKLTPEEFKAGFGSHTPLVTGWTHVVRYWPQFERTFSLLKQCALEDGFVFDASNCRVPLDDGMRDLVKDAASYEDLFAVFGHDFWAVTPCHSTSRQGHRLDGTRITLQKLEPASKGFEFSIRTPGTPSRWDDFEGEMVAAWDECALRTTPFRDALLATMLELGATAGSSLSSALMPKSGVLLQDLPTKHGLSDLAHHFCRAVLRLSFYWYNFMPLSRGTASIGFVVLQSLFLSVGLQFGTIPDKHQVDWEAILSPSFDTFYASVSAWILPQLRVASADVLKQLDATGGKERSVRDTFNALLI